MTGIGCVNPLRYPPKPLVLIFCAVIMINTTTAHAASVDRSEVGLRSPTRLIRFDTTLVAKSAATNGIIYLNFSPILPTTNLFAISTSISAKACRLEMFSSLRSCVSQIHTPVISSITIQLTTMVSLILKGPRTGRSMGKVNNIFAPLISSSIYSFTSHLYQFSVLYFIMKYPHDLYSRSRK